MFFVFILFAINILHLHIIQDVGWYDAVRCCEGSVSVQDRSADYSGYRSLNRNKWIVWKICKNHYIDKAQKNCIYTYTGKFEILSAEASYIHSSQIMRNSYLIDMANVKI